MFSSIDNDLEIFNKIKIKNKEIKKSKKKKQDISNMVIILTTFMGMLGTVVYFDYSFKGFLMSIITAVIISTIFIVIKVILLANLNKKYSKYKIKYCKNIKVFNPNNFINYEVLEEYIKYEKELSENGKYILSNKNIYVNDEEIIYHLVMKEIMDEDSESLLINLDSTVNMIKVHLNKVESHSHTIKMLFDKIFGDIDESLIYEYIEEITNIIEANFNKYKKVLHEIKSQYDETVMDETFEQFEERIKEKTDEELLEEKFEKLKEEEEEEYTW